MRSERIEHAQQERERFAEQRCTAGRTIVLEAVDLVHHLHRGRHNRVVLHTVKVSRRLSDVLIERTAQALLIGGGSLRVKGTGAGELIALRIGPAPEAAQEAEGAFGAGIAPGRGLIRGSGEHHERTGGIRAVLLDDVTRLNHVALRL